MKPVCIDGKEICTHFFFMFTDPLETSSMLSLSPQIAARTQLKLQTSFLFVISLVLPYQTTVYMW